MRPDDKRPEWVQLVISVVVILATAANFLLNIWTQKTVLEIKLDVSHMIDAKSERDAATYTRREQFEQLQRNIEQRLERVENANRVIR